MVKVRDIDNERTGEFEAMGSVEFELGKLLG